MLKTLLKARNDEAAAELVRTMKDLPESMQIEDTTPLHFAYPAEAIQTPTTLDMSPLWFAARYNMPKTVAELLRHDVDVDCIGTGGSIPSHAAALFRYYENAPNDEVVALLVEGRAEFNIQDQHYWTAFDMFDAMRIEVPHPTWFDGPPEELRHCDPQCCIEGELRPAMHLAMF